MKLKFRPLLSAVRSRPTAGLSCIEAWLLALVRDASVCRRFQSQSSTPRTSEPLRILFCGSDEFSVANLRALYDEHVCNPGLIGSIDVVVRPGKRVGRGYKKIQHPPLREVAEELSLPIHERDTFTGWNMPPNINLIIAVSFGLFVPPRLLRTAKYGGLNVHPSLLPEFKGPAPLHHTLLRCRDRTGVTLQTLDDKKFDDGIILAQTPLEDAYRVPDHITVPELQAALTPLATDMLVQSLRAGRHVPPHQAVGWTSRKIPNALAEPHKISHASQAQNEACRQSKSLGQIAESVLSRPQNAVEAPEFPDMSAHAPKVTTLMRQLLDPIPGGVWSIGGAVRKQRIIGPQWFMALGQGDKPKRVIVEGELGEVTTQDGEALFRKPGRYHHFKMHRTLPEVSGGQPKCEFDAYVWTLNDGTEDIFLIASTYINPGVPLDVQELSIRDVRHTALRISQLKIEGQQVKPAKAAFTQLSSKECQLQDIISAPGIPYYLGKR